MPNPHSYLPDGPICVIPEEMIDILYKRTNFLKKLIEEMSTEDSIRLLRFLIWENPDVTVLILSEIVAYVRLCTFLIFFSHFFSTSNLCLISDCYTLQL